MADPTRRRTRPAGGPRDDRRAALRHRDEVEGVAEAVEDVARRFADRAPGRHVTGSTLSAFLDDELDDDAAWKVTRHVTDCPTCRSELDELRGARAALRRLPRLQAPVLTAERRSLPRVRTWSRRLLALGAVVLAILAVLVSAYVLGGQGDVEPPVDRFLLDHLTRTGDGPVPAPYGGVSR